MKKSVLFIASLAMSMAVAAQNFTTNREKPVPTAKDFAAEDTCYLYNVEAEGFYINHRTDVERGPYWGTRAIVDNSIGAKMLFTRTNPEKEENWEVDGVTDNTYLLVSYVDASRISKFRCSFVDDDKGNVFTDDNTKAQRYFDIVKGTGKTFKIQRNDMLSGIEGSTTDKYLGVKENDAEGLVFLYALDEVKDAKFYSDWMLVAPVDYEAYLPKIDVYRAAQSLRAAIEKAYADHPGISLAQLIAVYDNSASTVEELKAAEAAIPAAIIEFLKGQASATNPVDFSSSIVNATFDKVGDFTGWSGTTFGAGGTTSTCAEHYNNDSFNSYQDVKDLPAGIYSVGVTAFYRAGSIANDWKTKDDVTVRNAKLYARTDADSLTTNLPSLSSWAVDSLKFRVGAKTGVEEELRVPNTMKDFTEFKEAGYGSTTSVFIPVEDGVRIGVVKKTKIDTDWTIVDDFTLTYYGNELDAYKLWSNQVLDNVKENLLALDETKPYDYTTYGKYVKATEDVKAATDKDALVSLTRSIASMESPIISSVAAYASLAAAKKDIDDQMSSNNYDSDLMATFSDLVYAEDKEASDAAIADLREAGAPDSLMNIVDVAPSVLVAVSGGNAYVEGLSCSKTTEEVKAYISALQKLYSYVISNSLQEGDDCTNMIVNASFKDGFNGWTYSSGNFGGLKALPVVEVYHNKVDVYQIINDVPDGVYALECNAFERRVEENVDPDNPNVFLYMNEFQTGVQDRLEGVLPKDEAVRFVNSFIPEEGKDELTPDQDFIVGAGCYIPDVLVTSKDGVEGYVPNGTSGSSYAFLAGRYKQTVYGLVQGGTMKIGLTSNGKGIDWTLWSNFKLIYKGKNAEALKGILPNFLDKLNETLTEYDGSLITTVLEKAINLRDTAEEAMKKDDTETMYNSIFAINAIMDELKENYNAVEALWDAADKLSDAMDEYGETASSDILNKAIELDEVARAFEDIATTEEVKALTEEIENITGALKLPADYTTASDEKPCDMTQVIVNPSFEDGVTGWSGTGLAHNAEVHNAEHYNKNYDTYQDLSGLPAGMYKVTVNGFYRQGASKDDYNATVAGTTVAHYNAYIYAIGENADSCKAPIMSCSTGALPVTANHPTEEGLTKVGEGEAYVNPNSMASGNAWMEEGYYTPTDEYNSVLVKVGEDGKLRIGVKKDVLIATDWSLFDDFTLTYYGADSEKVPTDIEGVATVSGNGAVKAIYTITGMPVETLQKGVNIVIYEDGSKAKVFVK